MGFYQNSRIIRADAVPIDVFALFRARIGCNSGITVAERVAVYVGSVAGFPLHAIQIIGNPVFCSGFRNIFEVCIRKVRVTANHAHFLARRTITGYLRMNRIHIQPENPLVAILGLTLFFGCQKG